jgi:hypothetical protein
MNKKIKDANKKCDAVLDKILTRKNPLPRKEFMKILDDILPTEV